MIEEEYNNVVLVVLLVLVKGEDCRDTERIVPLVVVSSTQSTDHCTLIRLVLYRIRYVE
jgi:hypothetical protein